MDTPKALSDKSLRLIDRLGPGKFRDIEEDRDRVLNHVLEFVDAQGLSLYPAQEEAILALFSGQNAILNTPTGSGKSMVATALHALSFAMGRTSVYTCPVKALVNEKFRDLCRDFGAENVGMQTGDATINGDAPILCCTAEILANRALREGESLRVDDVVMDEFHYYSDRERGSAWQIPLLTLPRARFLLMSATLGDVDFFQEKLTELTGRETAVVRGDERPVPLQFEYRETPLHETISDLVRGGKAPVYLVCFTQASCAEEAQNLMSVDFSSKEEKRAVVEALYGMKFTSPYGKEIQRFLKHGIGIHHAGLLPKYRVLIERLAGRGLLKVICGTDTLGVGVNVPIRTVLFTKLCKYDGEKTGVLSVRDFQQISGRAGRRGFDTQGFVVAQAPEHAIENLRMEQKAKDDPKKAKKMVRKQPPKMGYAHWDRATFDRLVGGRPERLQSRFRITHATVLNVLGRPTDGCKALRSLIRTSHEPADSKRRHAKQAFSLFRSLVERKIVEILPRETGAGAGATKVRVNVSLQDDFSLNQSLSLFMIDALAKLDPYSETYALDVLTLVESILESPDLILRKQLDRVKTEKLRELKAAGVEYDERMEELEKLEHPKPLRDFIYETFNEFAAKHPWVGGENIRPKSIAREMYELYLEFGEYVREYEIQRAEGLLLRYLSDVYKTLVQTVPELAKNEAIEEIETYLGSIVRSVDSSLVEEWERMRDPRWVAAHEGASRAAGAAGGDDPARPLLSPRERTIRIRNETFLVLRAFARGDFDEASGRLANAEAWPSSRLVSDLAPYFESRREILTSPVARDPRFTEIAPLDEGWSSVVQRLVDPERNDDWELRFRLRLLEDGGLPPENSAASAEIILESISQI